MSAEKAVENKTLQSGPIRSFDVWKIGGKDGLKRYRCFEDLATHQFCVQSADFYQQPVSVDRVLQLEQQFIELLVEQSPFPRSGSFATIQEAITNSDVTFERDA